MKAHINIKKDEEELFNSIWDDPEMYYCHAITIKDDLERTISRLAVRVGNAAIDSPIEMLVLIRPCK